MQSVYQKCPSFDLLAAGKRPFARLVHPARRSGFGMGQPHSSGRRENKEANGVVWSVFDNCLGHGTFAERATGVVIVDHNKIRLEGSRTFVLQYATTRS